MPRMSLEEARAILGWSRQRLADEAGLKISAIFDIESGRSQHPAYTTVMLIFRALQRGGLRGIDVTDIFPVPEPPDTDSKPSASGGQHTTERRAGERRRKPSREKDEVAA